MHYCYTRYMDTLEVSAKNSKVGLLEGWGKSAYCEEECCCKDLGTVFAC